jgi:hypothetical protein
MLSGALAGLVVDGGAAVPVDGGVAGAVVDGGAAVPVDGGLLGAVVCGGAALPLGAGALVVCATTGNIKASKDALSKVTFRGIFIVSCLVYWIW